MSAYIEGKAHIDALVRLTAEGPTDDLPVSPGNQWDVPYAARDMGGRDAIGALLIAENIASVQYRYHDEPIDDLPGPVDKASILDYHYLHGMPLTIGQALLALDGYEYQSCEHPGWPTSSAKLLCDQLRSALIARLPEYRAAETWSI